VGTSHRPEPFQLRAELFHCEALDGPVLPTEEDKNTNHGRNILFELNLAAKLWTVGIMPTLGEHPDLSCEIDGKKLLIGVIALSIGKARLWWGASHDHSE
jgi:hypothetical protein